MGREVRSRIGGAHDIDRIARSSMRGPIKFRGEHARKGAGTSRESVSLIMLRPFLNLYSEFRAASYSGYVAGIEARAPKTGR